MPDLQELGEAIKRGDRDTSVSLTQEAIDAAIPAQEILDVMVGAMDIVGQRFQKNEIFVPEMLIAARAMKESMALLEPVLVAAGITPIAKAVIGTVEGDLHDIGKNLVAMMWKGANFDVIDLGTNVSPQKFVDAVQNNDAQTGRTLGLADHDHAGHQVDGGCDQERRVGCHQGGHWRRPGHAGIRRRDWCRRLRPGRGQCRGRRSQTAGLETTQHQSRLSLRESNAWVPPLAPPVRNCQELTDSPCWAALLSHSSERRLNQLRTLWSRRAWAVYTRRPVRAARADRRPTPAGWATDRAAELTACSQVTTWPE